mgnify:FL=1
MKRTLNYLLVLFIFMFVGMISVSATSLKLDPETIEVGKNSTLTISNPTRSGDYKISYDKSILEARNNCGNSDIVLQNKVKDGCTIVFTAKKNLSLTENKKIEIKLSDDGGSTPEVKTLTVKANTTTTTTTTTSPSTTTQTAISTTKAKSNNAKLKELKITSEDKVELSYTPKFSSSINEYSLNVDGSISRVIINATLEDSNASLVISDNVKSELVAGENNKITITVLAEDGQTKNTYTINVLRDALETDATLKSLKIKEYPSFKFSADKFSYNVEVDSSVKKLTFDYTLASDKSSVEISGNDELKDGSVVKLTVTSEDGSKREYKFTVIKTKKTSTTEKVVTVSSNKNPLIIIGLSLIAFGLIGGIVYVAKK